MSFSTFNAMCSKLYHYYKQNCNVNCGESYDEIFEWKLGICLRFYARCECLTTLKNLFGCCEETVRSSIHNFTNFINSALFSLQIDLSDQEYLCRKAILDACGIDGYAFIVDGTHFRILKTPNGVPSRDFFNRKGWKSITGQVVIDPFFRVVQLDIGYTGNTNDVSMYNHAPFKQILKLLIDRYGEYYCCIGDNGYPTRKEMLNPYTGEEIRANSFDEYEKEMFSRILSSVRQIVERVFGILQRKWHLLVSGCEYSLQKFISFIFAIFNVHNFMLAIEEAYKFRIMDENWQYSNEGQSLERNIQALIEVRNSDELLVDGSISELKEGEQKRDIIRRALMRT